MFWLGRADIAVVGYVQPVEQVAEMTAHLVGEVAGGLALLFRLASHFQPMLVGACLEPDIAPLQALESCDHIGGNRLVSVADMRLAVGIMDRGGDIVRVSHWPRS